MIGHVVSEKKMFEDNGYMQVYSPLTGAYNLLGSLCFQNYKSVALDICCKCFPVNYFVKVFPIQTHTRPLP